MVPARRADGALRRGRRPVSRIEPATDEQLVEMVKRYLPPEKVDGYLEFARREHGEGVVIFVKPEHWLSADLGRSRSV